jgi:uncharacterized membrane protein YidH (DUF202 family)
MSNKFKFIINRIGVILSGLALIAFGISKFVNNDNTFNKGVMIGPTAIIIGILLLVVVIIRWKDLENIGK